ncbi:MAG: hypothetical protein AAF676_18555, partial [Pseudomonadota bacterium]
MAAIMFFCSSMSDTRIATKAWERIAGVEASRAHEVKRFPGPDARPRRQGAGKSGGGAARALTLRGGRPQGRAGERRRLAGR